MTGRRRGRPPADTPPLNKDAIVAAGIALLDEAGPAGFSMRALAGKLGVTPMALYHHAGSRDRLLASMSAAVYAGIDVPIAGEPRAEIEALLLRYCERVLAHPGMTHAIFADSRLVAGPAARLTDRLGALLSALTLDVETARHWRDILIDYTHGFAVAIAAARGIGAAEPGTAYRVQLAMLIDSVDVVIVRPAS